MKLLAAFSFLFLIGVKCIAQEPPLPYDERGKLICYEVVQAAGLTKQDLSVRANAFIKKKARYMRLKSAKNDTLLQAEGKLVINKTALVLTRPSGEVQYNLYVEAKDNKYRFWFTDFEFIPYQRDRYGNFVASTTVGRPLESNPGKLNAGEWKTYVSTATKEVRLLAGQFKDAMSGKLQIVPAPKAADTISTKKW